MQILDEAVDKGHEFIMDKQTALSNANKAGGVAMQWERVRLSEKKG